MELTPVGFLMMFLLLAALGYIVFTCAARLVAWLVSRMIGGVVRFRIAGLNGLKEIYIDLQKGPIASVTISELKVSVRKPSSVTSWNVFSWFSKFQLTISEVEIILRDSQPEKKKNRNAMRKHKRSPTGRGKWMLVTNLARYLNVSVNDITAKFPESTKLALEIKEVDFDSFRDEASLGVKIFLAPCVLYVAEDKDLPRVPGIFGTREKLEPARTEFVVFSLEQFTLSGALHHDRETGVMIKQLDAGIGDVLLNLKPDLFPQGNEEVDDDTPETEALPDVEISPDSAGRTLAGKIPETIELSMPKLELNIYVGTEFPSVKSYVKSVFLRGNRSQQLEGSISAFDLQMDVGEIHVCEEQEHSVIDITKVSVGISVEMATQLNRPLRAEVDVKFGDTQFNIYMNRYGDLVQLASLRPMRRRSRRKKPKASGKPSISWSCSISAPETTVFLYSPDGVPLVHLSSQTSHLYVNINPGQGVVVHGELGELYLDTAEGGQTHSSFSGYPDSLMHMVRMSLDSGLDAERTGETPAFVLEAGSTEINLGMRKLEAAIVALFSIQSCVKRFPWKRKTGGKERDRSKTSSSSSSLIKLNLQRVHFFFEQEVHVEDVKVPDPKKVNFGSQGGVTVITKQGDNLRTAVIRPASFCTNSSSDGLAISCAKQQLGMTLFQIAISVDRKKRTVLWEMDAARAVYKELGVRDKVLAERTVLALQNLKLIHRPAEVGNEVLMHLFVSANDATAYWDPDVHLFFYELNLRLKEVLRRHRGADSVKSSTSKVSASKTVFALDIERMSFSAELADGVKGTASIQSIFSEDAAVGMLFENIDLALNKATVLRTDRLQVSRVPALVTEPAKTVHQLWDIIIQGAGVQIIMPYRLPLRAIDDAVEDMWRGLKLVMAAKRSHICRRNVSEGVKPKPTSSFRVYSIKLNVRGITAEIEEEPFQGWLDEHHRLLRQQSRMLLVRERLLEESSKLVQPEMQAKKRELWEQLQEQTFQEYKQACMKLSPSKGSGACNTGFQAGFRPSVKRSSVMSITAEKLELTLTDIKGGQHGMVELIRKLDCVKPELEVPFARLIGRHVIVAAEGLSLCLRDYTVPILSSSTLNCEGNVIFAQQATCFQNQIVQHMYVGRWRKLEMWRSASGTTPSYKFYSELPIHLGSGKVGFGVGFEPTLADVSYAFTVALRKYNLSVRDPGLWVPPVKKEKSLPWWDDMRYYVHGVNSVNVTDFEWSFLATPDPYELQNRMLMVATTMHISQTEGRLSFLGTNFDMFISSLESSASSGSRNHRQFIHAPVFQLDISMDWSCASGNPLQHYLHAFPNEPQCRPIVYDPFRSLSLSLIWSFSLRTSTSTTSACAARLNNRKGQKVNRLQPAPSFSRFEIPFMNLCSQDLIWIFKWWNLYFSPPYKLRLFSRYPRFGVERVARSGNLSLDKVTTEFILRLDATPASIRHFSQTADDPAKGLAFSMQKLRYELFYSRGLQKYSFEDKRDILDLVYHGLDVHLLKTKLKRSGNTEPAGHKHKEDDFLLSTDCFTMRRQSPKADTSRLSLWRENVHSGGSDYYKLSDSENSDPMSSDPSDDDGFNVVLADNCLRVSLYGLKLYWTIDNRNAVWAWVGEISKAFEAPKPSPSRQYAQRKIMEEKQKTSVIDCQGVLKLTSSASSQAKAPVRSNEDVEEEGTLQFMVNVIHPQFNLHSEDAHGRFLLAAASGRVLARSFHSIFFVGFEVIEQALGAGIMPIHGNLPQVSWKRRELSVLLEHVQAHVAPTDVDPGAGIQWLPRIPTAALKVKRTGALLERVFLPCSMYFQYIRHKGGTTDCKVKPLKELSFNSPNITATMTSRQFHIMVDVLSSLLFATLPKPRKGEEEEDIQEAADEVVPDGVEEVELARIKLEHAERDYKLTSDDLKVVKLRSRVADGVTSPDQLSSGESPDGSLNRALSRTSALVQRLEVDLSVKRKARKAAYASVRLALQRAAQQRLMEKEKNKSPSAAMRISWAIDKVVWSMLSDGETFAEAEISNMTLNVDRDFSDMGAARFNVKSFVVKNGLPHAKSDTVLSAWNAPVEWGRNVMLRVDARQGAPKDGLSLLELFQVEIYPLKIHLTESMYTMMWDYFFPGDEQDPQIRQEVWRGSAASGNKRSRKGASSDQTVTKTSSPGTPPSVHGTPQRVDSAASTSQSLAVSRTSKQSEHSSLSLGWAENEETAELLVYADSTSMLKNSATPGADELLAALSPVCVTTEADSSKSKDVRKTRPGKSSQEEKKETKYQKLFLEIHNIKISQVELLVTYEGSKFSVSDFRLLMDNFTRSEFTGSWRRLFSRVKKHIIWGVLKSVTGMQGKKFKDKKGAVAFQDSDSNSSDSISSTTRIRARFPIPHFQKHGDRAGEGFVSSIRGLFNSQKRKTKALVRNIRGEESQPGSEGDNRTHRSKSKLLRRHSKKQRAGLSKGAILLGDRYPSPRGSPTYHSDAESSSGSSTYEDFEM